MGRYCDICEDKLLKSPDDPMGYTGRCPDCTTKITSLPVSLKFLIEKAFERIEDNEDRIDELDDQQ